MFFKSNLSYQFFFGFYVITWLISDSKYIGIGFERFGITTLYTLTALIVFLQNLHRKIIIPKVSLLLLAFVIVAPLGLLINNPSELPPYHGYLTLINRGFLLPVLLGVIFYNLSLSQQLSVFLSLEKLILVLAILGSILSFVQFFTSTSSSYLFLHNPINIESFILQKRVIGLAVKPAIWAMFLAFALFILIGKREQLGRIKTSSIFIILMCSFLMTQSRSTIGAFLIVVFLHFLWRSMRGVRLIVCLGLLFGFVFSIVITHFTPFLPDIFKLYALEDLSISQRLNLNEQLLSIFSSYPLFGIGYDAFPSYFYEQNLSDFVSEYGYKMESEAINVKVETHNFFFGLLAQTGIIGSALFLLYFGKLFSFMLRKKHVVVHNIIVKAHYYGFGFLVIFISCVGQDNQQTVILWAISFIFYMLYALHKNKETI